MENGQIGNGQIGGRWMRGGGGESRQRAWGCRAMGHGALWINGKKSGGGGL